MFFVFAGIEFFGFLTRDLQAEHLATHYLDRISIEGRLSAADESEMVDRFSDIGLTVTGIDAPRESQGHPRVLRNSADPDASEVWLKVTGETDEGFLFGRLVGSSTEDSVEIQVGGRTLSERLDP